MESEILILGGSLAGMACAIGLRQLGYSPLVLEKSHFPRKKLCGEFLGPDALNALQSLELLTRVQELAFGPVEQTRFYNREGQSVKIRHAWMDGRFPYGLALSREVLDALLVTYARTLGITVLEGQRVLSPILRNAPSDAHLPKAKLFQVRAQTVGKNDLGEQLFQSRFLIDATGRSGKLILSSPNDKPAPDKKRNAFNARVGVQCHVRLSETLESKDLRMFLFAGGYGGIQPIGDRLANVCVLVDAALGKALHLPFSEFISATIGQNPAALKLLVQAQREGDFSTTADVNLSGEAGTEAPRNRRDTLLRIGDACISVDPFTGSGMAHALETGLLAAQSIHLGILKNWPDARMLAHYQSEYDRRFKMRLQWMRIFRPLLENDRLQSWAWPFLPPVLPWLAKGLR